MRPPASTIVWRAFGSEVMGKDLPFVLFLTSVAVILSSSPSSASIVGQITVRRPTLIELCRKMRAKLWAIMFRPAMQLAACSRLADRHSGP
jgi:hypothetical protein